MSFSDVWLLDAERHAWDCTPQEQHPLCHMDYSVIFAAAAAHGSRLEAFSLHVDAYICPSADWPDGLAVGSFLADVSQLFQLRLLAVVDCVWELPVGGFSALTALQTLLLQGNEESDVAWLLPRGLARLPRLECLAILCVDDTRPGEIAGKMLPPSLTELLLDHVPGLTAMLARAFASGPFTQLQHLGLSWSGDIGVQQQAAFMNSLSMLPALRSLQLRDFALEDAACRCRLPPSVTTLDLGGHKLSQLPACLDSCSGCRVLRLRCGAQMHVTPDDIAGLSKLLALSSLEPHDRLCAPELEAAYMQLQQSSTCGLVVEFEQADASSRAVAACMEINIIDVQCAAMGGMHHAVGAEPQIGPLTCVNTVEMLTSVDDSGAYI